MDPCQLYLLLKDKTGNSVAEFTIFNLPKGSEGPAVAGATFVAPLETLLPTGMTMQIDGGKGKAYPFTFCAQIGCISRIGFTAEEIEAMKLDPTKKEEVDKRMAGTSATFPVKLKEGETYTVVVETVGDEMRVSIDGKGVAFLKSPGIGHETKSKIELGVAGQSGSFDEIKVWNAAAK